MGFYGVLMTSMSSACVSDLVSALAYKIKALSCSPQEVRVLQSFRCCKVFCLHSLDVGGDTCTFC